MHRHFSTALSKFPFSTQASQVYLRVAAADPTEPALFEHVYKAPDQLEDIFEDMEKWKSPDACFELEGSWDLWQQTTDGWQLKPSRVNLFFFGPDYSSDLNEAIRAELGIESVFLPPNLEVSADLHYYQSNIKSLLRLHNDWAVSLRLKDRKLWSESPQDLIERLQWFSQSTPASNS